MSTSLAPRLVDLAREQLEDPAEPWEPLADEADFRPYKARCRAAYALIPRSLDAPELPVGAVGELEASVGALAPGRMVYLPPTPRVVGPRSVVVTPACVMAVGETAVALWANRDGNRIVARIPFAEIAAIADLTVLLFGRLEIVVADSSIVLRYNTVGRPEIRTVLALIRGAFEPLRSLPGAPAGPSPDDLPFKWMALLRTGDLRAADATPRIVTAGTLAAKHPVRRPGIAAASALEIAIAVQPHLAGGVGAYGVDLVALPTARTRRLTAVKGGLEATVATGSGEVALRLPTHESLADAVTRSIAPSLGA